MLDHAAALDARRGWSRPLTFTNWITLDPLDHPVEPLAQEDLVSVDATHLSATDAWPGGFFASYHANPYYPEFIRLTESYRRYERPRDGEVDPYSGYLHELREYHGHPGVLPEADVALVVGPEDAELPQAAWWEPTRIRYGLGSGYLDSTGPTCSPAAAPGCIRSRSSTGRSGSRRRARRSPPIARLAIGTGDPEADGFDQRTLVAARGTVVEVRLPWALLGYSDPSSRKLLVEHPKRAATTEDAGPIRAAIATGDAPVLTTSEYEWEPWEEVTWHERRKAGFDDLAEAMRELSAPRGDG